MSERTDKHYQLKAEIKILQNNVKELQGQLASAHQRIGELNKQKDTNEELESTKQLLRELQFELNSVKKKEETLIQKHNDNIPDVTDSRGFKPDKRFLKE